MRSAGRAIEIAAVGLGQAGGNLAAEFHRRGYRALALNTATTDLSSLTHGVATLPEEQRFYIGLEGYDGAGGDVAYGRECIRTYAAGIRERIAEHVAGADIVLLVAGLGGGTGSALCELIRVLGDLAPPIVALATLPSAHESGIVKVNAMRALSELVKQDVFGWCFADNSCLARHHGAVSFDRYYAEINRVIVEPLDAFNCLNARGEISAIRALDGEDYRTLLLSRGILTFATAMLSRLSGEAVLEALREGMLHSNFQPEGFRLENVSYLAVVIEASESMLADTPFSFIEEINAQLKQETGGAAIHTGIYRVSASKPLATLRVFASSQSLPDGVQELVEQARREGGALQDKLQREVAGLELGEVADYQLFRGRSGQARRRVASEASAAAEARVAETAEPIEFAETEAMELSELPEPVEVAEPLELPPPVELVIGLPRFSPASKLSAWKAQRANPAPARDELPAFSTPSAPRSASGDVPDRDAYDQLVREFKEAETDEIKRRVSERLQLDQRSDNSRVRYYAVRTMSKIDADIFAGSLQMATRDEDATVRAAAIKALNRS